MAALLAVIRVAMRHLWAALAALTHRAAKTFKSHGDDLEARCQTRNGDWHKTKLDDFQKCRGQIINEDGN